MINPMDKCGNQTFFVIRRNKTLEMCINPCKVGFLYNNVSPMRVNSMFKKGMALDFSDSDVKEMFG